MGLISEEIPAGDHDLNWNQTLLQSPPTRRQQPPQQQQGEQLKCPRCDSTNTKFCYYNNYNRSQPRHFCKACKRHWTKGGTLRNVPVGGVRKNKRAKRTNSSATTTSAPAATNTSKSNGHFGMQNQNFPLGLLQDGKIFMGNNGIFTDLALPEPQDQSLLQVSFSSLNSFHSNLSSVPTSFQPWQVVPSTGTSVMDSPSYWNWSDLDTMGAADHLHTTLDEEIKP
ncbi:hypothetical protein RJ640_030147 [Escallonia rubra]|uniref:Dof zinc finger protein n=1 Tax=Escallonia rubra TaxID=112253 RepID=A0AA88QPT5_9ASTE|nr:hypothetical protein RJ640_030147 [Escallonia rubra]